MIIEPSDICNFADDSTLYSRGEKLTEIKENLFSDTKSILKWFRLNSSKANPEKFQFMFLGDKSHQKQILKLASAIFYQIFIFAPNDSPSKTMENAFYFI